MDIKSKITKIKLQSLGKQIGASVKPVEDVKHIEITAGEERYVFENPEVGVLNWRGVNTYIIGGIPKLITEK